MNTTDPYNKNTIRNIHITNNKRSLSYLKDANLYNEIIVPFAEKKVNQDITASSLVGRFYAMSSLPINSKYVVYGSEALVHPETGIVFGFITGVNVIYRLPDNLLKEFIVVDLVN